jgi:hypothetical protein
MVKDRSSWIISLLAAMVLLGMALTVIFGSAAGTNHGYGSRGGSIRGR